MNNFKNQTFSNLFANPKKIGEPTIHFNDVLIVAKKAINRSSLLRLSLKAVKLSFFSLQNLSCIRNLKETSVLNWRIKREQNHKLSLIKSVKHKKLVLSFAVFDDRLARRNFSVTPSLTKYSLFNVFDPNSIVVDISLIYRLYVLHK